MSTAMQSLVRVLLFAVFLQFTLSGRAQEQQGIPDDQVIRVNVELVQVDVQVLEKKTGRIDRFTMLADAIEDFQSGAAPKS